MENLFLLLRTKDFPAFLKAELKEWLRDHAFGRKENDESPLLFCRTIPVRACLLNKKLRISGDSGKQWLFCYNYWRNRMNGECFTAFIQGQMNRNDLMQMLLINTAEARLSRACPNKLVMIAYGYIHPMWDVYDGDAFTWTWARSDASLEEWQADKFNPCPGESKTWVARESLADRDFFPEYISLGEIIPDPTSVPLFSVRYLLSLS